MSKLKTGLASLAGITIGIVTLQTVRKRRSKNHTAEEQPEADSPETAAEHATVAAEHAGIAASKAIDAARER